MLFCSPLPAVTSVCVGLIVSTAALAEERAGLFVPHPGMQFTTAFTNDFGRDAESLTTVTSVTGNAVNIDYSSSRGVSVRRELLKEDREAASSYVLGYEADMPTLIRGTTSLGISARVLSELRSNGRARLTLVYSPQLASIDCDLTRVSSNVMMRLIVEDRIVDIRSMHARAQCGQGERTASGDFYFANDLNQPLLIESILNFSWEKRPRTERIVRVVDGLGLHPDMEQSLKTIGKYDAYGLRFDFDSAVLRPESVQLVREIAHMLQANRDWQIQIVGHTDSTGGPEYILVFPTSAPRPCGWRWWTTVSSEAASAPKAAARRNPRRTMTLWPGAPSTVAWNSAGSITTSPGQGPLMRSERHGAAAIFRRPVL